MRSTVSRRPSPSPRSSGSRCPHARAGRRRQRPARAGLAARARSCRWRRRSAGRCARCAPTRAWSSSDPTTPAVRRELRRAGRGRPRRARRDPAARSSVRALRARQCRGRFDLAAALAAELDARQLAARARELVVLRELEPEAPPLVADEAQIAFSRSARCSTARCAWCRAGGDLYLGSAWNRKRDERAGGHRILLRFHSPEDVLDRSARRPGRGVRAKW